MLIFMKNPRKRMKIKIQNKSTNEKLFDAIIFKREKNKRTFNMGLLKGAIIVTSVYYLVKLLWDNKLNPLSEERKKSGLLYFILFSVLFLEILLTF
jgi:hypothetical protein